MCYVFSVIEIVYYHTAENSTNVFAKIMLLKHSKNIKSFDKQNNNKNQKKKSLGCYFKRKIIMKLSPNTASKIII